MRLANFSYIVAGNLGEKKLRTALAISVIAFAMVVALGVTALSTGLLRGLQQRVSSLFPPTVIMVKPKTVALAMLAFNSAVIDDKAVEKIRALPGVERVEPQLSLRVPLRMEVEIAGQYAVTDAVVIGVEPSTLVGDLRTGTSFEYDETTSQPIPCVVPRLLLDMYNLAYADSIGLPKINEDFLINKKFTMVLGGTYLAGSKGDKETKLLCKVVGMVSDPSLVPGVYMPVEYVQRINQDFSGEDEAVPYTALRVIIDRPDQVSAISKQLADMGLNVEGKQWAYESISSAIQLSSLLLYAFAVVILLVTAFAILNLFSLMMSSRLGEIRLLRAVGATQADLRWIYFSEALVIAVAGVIVGGLVAGGLLSWIEHMIRARLKAMDLADFSLIPERVFAFDFLPVLGVTCCIILVSVAAPLIVTWKSTARVSGPNGAV